jgi:hypothetical protein
MKRTLLSFCLLLIACIIYGQAQEGTVEYQKSQQPAAVIELSYAPDIVTAAMNDYLSKKGKSKGNDIKGFTTFRNTQPTVNDNANADLYFKMERKSRQEKQVTIVSLLLTVPKEGPATETVHHLNMDQAKAYLNDLVPAIEAYNLELEIKNQNEAVAKSESKYKNLGNDGEDLEKRKLSIEKNVQENKQNIQENKNAQQNQLAEVEAQKQKLAELVNRRKG